MMSETRLVGFVQSLEENQNFHSPNVTFRVTFGKDCSADTPPSVTFGSDLAGLAEHAQHHDPLEPTPPEPEHPAAEINRLLQDLEYLTSRLRMALARLTD